MKNKKRVLTGIALLLAVFFSGNALAADRVVVVPLNTCKDKNLQPENVCLGVTICGVSGTRACSRDTFATVTSAGGRVWMDRNLGASRVATSATDTLAYGDLYQWGRSADGHQRRTSLLTDTTSPTNDPGHGSFIAKIIYGADWLAVQDNTLWQGVSGINNPCPVGFRVPTAAEWEIERRSWATNDASGAFASPLKLVMAGGRTYDNGSLTSEGLGGTYWSSTTDPTDDFLIRRLYFDKTDAQMFSNYRAWGFSVRCIKD